MFGTIQYSEFDMNSKDSYYLLCKSMRKLPEGLKEIQKDFSKTYTLV